MKARLLYRDRDLDLERPAPWNEEALTKDLSLDTLLQAMARRDKLVLGVAKAVLLSGVANDLETIRYRQGVLQDCLDHPDVVRELYALAGEAMEKEKKRYLGSTLMRYPHWVLRQAIERLGTFRGFLKTLRRIADAHSDTFVSEGWTTLFATLRSELSDEFFARLQDHLEQLKFPDGVLLGARPGKGNKGAGIVLHVLRRPRLRGWERLKRLVTERLRRLLGRSLGTWLFGRQPPVFEFSLDPRDQSGARALEELRGRGIGVVADALGRSTDHIRSFFSMLQAELAFYVGCVNLHEQLARKGEPTSFPSPAAPEERRLSFRGLYNVCLALSLERRVVGNDADADTKDLVIVTGANQGGKSTFLGGVGLAQLMMQCGMFVPAESFRSSVCDGLFTHYKREEDASMKSGKLDEELRRMSEIVDGITSRSMLLFNESFAATNEREGSEVGRQIVSALLEKRVRMVFVTHLYEFADGLYRRRAGNVLFLRADRQADGARTFQLVEGEPLRTSFGEDLYDAIFGPGRGRCGPPDPASGGV